MESKIAKKNHHSDDFEQSDIFRLNSTQALFFNDVILARQQEKDVKCSVALFVRQEPLKSKGIVVGIGFTDLFMY